MRFTALTTLAVIAITSVAANYRNDKPVRTRCNEKFFDGAPKINCIATSWAPKDRCQSMDCPTKFHPRLDKETDGWLCCQIKNRTVVLQPPQMARGLVTLDFEDEEWTPFDLGDEE